MSLSIFTTDAAALLAEIKKQIDTKKTEKGHIDTWAYDNKGNFTHTPLQFNQKAWFEPEIKEDRLRLRLFTADKKPIPRYIYSAYHGRFIEMLITHVPGFFSAARATPNPLKDDTPIEKTLGA